MDPLLILPAGGGLAVIRHWAVLTKLPIAMASTLTALIGYRLAGGAWSLACLTLSAATLFLAMGAAALNEIQERSWDARMDRTRHRPLPSGSISVNRAGGGALVMVVVGMGGLMAFGLGSAGAGLLALVWYNGVYTPLKRHTAWAVLPGALIGAIPPFIGWMAAGRGPLAAPVLVFAVVIFLWQVPHFWALVLIHSRDYARGGFPTLDQRLSGPGLARLTFAWVLLLATSSVLIPGSGLIVSPAGMALLVIADLVLLWGGWGIFRDTPGKAGRVFHAVNAFALLLAALVLLDPWLR
ncbi:protoheme IX farnesyltransferase [Holophaga foetida]|uniref:protoheme IX farnesyltransferase n=1 Tax=Holophaga foetida TaxID=35839 RepID=UPI0002472EFE|nr:protoheme IX farnesyltransferase [Holophaga foetida]